MEKPLPRVAAAICWACLALAAGWVVAGVPLAGWNPLPLFLLSLPVSIILSTHRYGGRGALIYWVTSIVVSNAWENLSILTGFPFGHYHYSGGPKVFLVPVFIGPIYASLGYLSWVVANWILGQADRALGRLGNLFILPLISGAVMTMWDVVTDPQASTFGGAWIWHDGGNVFGVPESNFLGWWFVTYSFFQIFALYLWKARRPLPESTSATANLLPILFYFLLGASVIADFAVSWASTVTAQDPVGVVWRRDHYIGVMFVMTLFTMTFVSLVALQRWREARAKLA